MRERYEMKGQTQQQSRRDPDSKPQMAIPNATHRVWDPIAICAGPPTPSIAFQAPPAILRQNDLLFCCQARSKISAGSAPRPRIS